MVRDTRNFEHLLGGKAKGLSDLQLKEHFKLYQGYVKKLNEIWERLQTADRSSPNYSFDAYSELKRREPIAFNGTVLHELYFENIGNGSTQPDAEAKRIISDSFGSFEHWLTDAAACLMSGHGWLIVSFDDQEKRLFNNLIHTAHDGGLMANTRIMIAVDAWEHAYFFDYQTKKGEYVANMLSGLNWDVINQRLRAGAGAAI